MQVQSFAHAPHKHDFLQLAQKDPYWGERKYLDIFFSLSIYYPLKKMYQDTFEEDDLIAEVELVAQARYSQNNDVDDGFDTEGKDLEKVFLP